MLTKKSDVEELIRNTIDAGHEVAIYRGTSLRTADEFEPDENWWPTQGVTPVYIGRVYNSAISELEDRLGKDPLTYGVVHVIPNKDGSPVVGHVTTEDDIHSFDFRGL